MPAFKVEVVKENMPFRVDFFKAHGLLGINCGSGKMLRPGWLNVDQIAMTDANGKTPGSGKLFKVTLDSNELYYLEHDLTRPFPVADHAFNWGYSEHFIEHVTPEIAIDWLREMRRVISPGGLLRVTTPDLKKYIDGYADSERKFFRMHTERMEKLTGNIGSVPQRPAWMVNHIFRFFKHQWIYDFEELVHAATQAGFDPAGISREKYQSGQVEEVSVLDWEDRNDETLYVEMKT